MKRMDKNIKYLCVVLALLAGAACTDDFERSVPDTVQGTEQMVGITLDAMPLTGSLETRALDANLGEETRILDAWILQYDKATKGMIGVPKYYTAEELFLPDGDDADEEPDPAQIPVILPPSGRTYTFVAIVNTHDPTLNNTLSGADDLEKLKALSLKVKGLNSLYNELSTSEGSAAAKSAEFLMSGYTDIVGGGAISTLDFKLYRNVAKLTLKIENHSGSGVSVKTVRVRNIPDKLFYADRIYDYKYWNGSDLSFYNANHTPVTDGTTFMDYELETFTAGEPSEQTPSVAQSYVYYLPRNCRGVKTNSSATYTKNTYAPVGATFVEIMALQTKGANAGAPVRYRFYLGDDMVTDFNVIPNKHYTLTVSITDIGSSQLDARVEDMSNMTLKAANSYIINPLENSTVQCLYTMPVAEIPNQFWAENENGYIQNNSNDKWIAEVIWQDRPYRLIQFCQADGTPLTGDVFESYGLNPLYFKPVLTEGNTLQGNVLIGVRKAGNSTAGQDYLWSWHLWITDYSPDDVGAAGWGSGQYKYAVRGGEVHRYADGTGSTLWSGTYNNHWIMDRNLGAMDESYTGDNDFQDVLGLCYQFGRKDPFLLQTSYNPAKAELYNIKGENVTSSGMWSKETGFFSETDHVIKKNVNATFKEAVQNPQIFYAPGGDWAVGEGNTKNPYTNEGGKQNFNSPWNNPKATSGSDYTKSIFDPCPPGWKIPQSGTWGIFGDKNAVKKTDGSGNMDYSSRGLFFYMSAVGEGPTVYYPASGYRNSGDGTVSYVGSIGYDWSATPNNATGGRYLDFSSSNVYPSRNSSRAYGFPVRCLKE